ncbi:unnamed protein product, partial [Rotaria sp. Silwood1]
MVAGTEGAVGAHSEMR